MLGAMLCLAAACQDEGGFSLSSPGFGFTKSATWKAPMKDPCAEVSDGAALVREMLESVNAERAAHDLPSLRLDATLTQIAEFYACRLVDGGFFDHKDPYDGSRVATRAADFGYAYLKVGENLAAGFSVQETMTEWLKSPSHRAIILDPLFTEVGIAVRTGGAFGSYRVWVQEFGRPLTEPLDLAFPEQPGADESGAAAESETADESDSSGTSSAPEKTEAAAQKAAGDTASQPTSQSAP